MRKFLVFGMIHPIGIGNENRDNLFEYFKAKEPYNYELNLIHISKQFGNLSRDEKINFGNKLRELSGSNDILSIYAILKIVEKLKKVESDKVQLFLIYSLKNKDEIKRLREFFGSSFYLIGLQLSKDEDYFNNLVQDLKEEEKEEELRKKKAEKLIERDSKEKEIDYGQKLIETYHDSDFYITINQEKEHIIANINRFLDLVINKNPYHTPSQDEYFMNLAFITSMRSLSLGRRVGAVIVSENNDVLAVGCNEVPKFGGGQYWPGDANDAREYFHLKSTGSLEANKAEINKIKIAIFDKFICKNDSYKSNDFKEHFDEILKEMDCITEFMREVHAEAEAIHSCARNGIRTIKSKLYCTTLPCHYCAKHIVSAGIEEVYYIQPYSKSKVNLFDDSITFKDEAKKVKFKRFSGIGPNKYSELFIPASSMEPELNRQNVSREQLPTIDYQKLIDGLRSIKIEIRDEGYPNPEENQSEKAFLENLNKILRDILQYNNEFNLV